MDRVEGEKCWRFDDTHQTLTAAQEIEWGVREHPSVMAYIQAVKSLKRLWDEIPDGRREMAEYSVRRVAIPHITYAKTATIRN